MSRFYTQGIHSSASILTPELKQLKHQSDAVPPIIIIGMHRSGTSLLSRLLESLGLFLGRVKDENNEALFFQSINDWLLRQTGGAWDNPGSIRYLLDNPELRSKTADYIRRYLLASPRAVSFFGWGNYLRCGRLHAQSKPWGWKDPRNTFTLPIWLDIFPEAKIIHLHRAGMDVALSLRRRGRNKFQWQRFYRKMPVLHWMCPKRGGFVHSLRCDHLEGALALWREYVDQGTSHVSALQDRACEISFETLVSEPVKSLQRLAQFCNLPVREAALAQASQQINTDVLSSPALQPYEARLHSS